MGPKIVSEVSVIEHVLMLVRLTHTNYTVTIISSNIRLPETSITGGLVDRFTWEVELLVEVKGKKKWSK